MPKVENKRHTEIETETSTVKKNVEILVLSVSEMLHKLSISWLINTDTHFQLQCAALFHFFQGAEWLLELPLSSLGFQCCKYYRKWQHGHKELLIYAELQWATMSHKKKSWLQWYQCRAEDRLSSRHWLKLALLLMLKETQMSLHAASYQAENTELQVTQIGLQTHASASM